MNHGPKMSAEDYMEAISTLYSLTAITSDDELIRYDVSLSIDHLLGIDFPMDRREQFITMRLKLEHSIWRKLTIGAAIIGVIVPYVGDWAASKYISYQKKQFTAILNEEELAAYFTEG